MKLYGNLINRLEEGRNYLGRDIQVDDCITSYSYSDRHSYYITKVIDQNHIFVKPFEVCADHDKAGGMGHQDWVFFKTYKELVEYLTAHGVDRDYNEEYEANEQEWKIYRGHWNHVSRWTKEVLDKIREEDKFRAAMIECSLGEKNMKKLNAGKEVVIYTKLNKISFVSEPDYYYDWEF